MAPNRTEWRINEPLIYHFRSVYAYRLPPYTVATVQFTTLTHWGRVTHICVDNLTGIGLDNGLSPGRRQAIIWTNDGILLIGPSGTNFSEVLIEIHIFSLKRMHWKMSSGKWRPYCLGLNVLTHRPLDDVEGNLNVRFSNTFDWMIAKIILAKLYSECQGTPLIISWSWNRS